MTTESNLVEARVTLRAAQHGIVSVPTELGIVTAGNVGHGWRISKKPVPMSNREALDLVFSALSKVPGGDRTHATPINWNGTVDIRV